MLFNEPHPLETKVLTRRFGKPNSAAIEGYLADDGYQGFLKAAKMKPEEIIEEVKVSNLRGRRGFSNRDEVEFRAAQLSQAQIHCGQRG
jgi:NADH-quinone oxidoreductase subunit F